MPLLDDAKNCFVGQTQIKQIYAGTQKVWPKELVDPDMIYLSHCDKWDLINDHIEEYKNSTYIKDSEGKEEFIKRDSFLKFDGYYGFVDSGINSLIINFTDNVAALKNQEFTIDFWHNNRISINPTRTSFCATLDVENFQSSNPNYRPIRIESEVRSTSEEYYNARGLSGSKEITERLGFQKSNMWWHIAIWWKGRNNGYDWNVWLNGVTNNSGYTYNDATQAPYLKRLVLCDVGSVTSSSYSHRFDEVRISKGKKYTGNFTPPTSPYPIYK